MVEACKHVSISGPRGFRREADANRGARLTGIPPLAARRQRPKKPGLGQILPFETRTGL